MTIRDADFADLPAILAILDQAIRETTAIWDETPITRDTLAAAIDGRRGRGFPTLVSVEDGQVSGYACFDRFRAYSGFARTVEHSLYVAPSSWRRGHGATLLAALEDRARALDLHVMVGAVTADNFASRALHARAGFVEIGLMPQVGRKFGRWLDLVWLQKRLGATLAGPPGGR